MKHPVLLTTLLTLGSHATAASCPPAVTGIKGLLDAEYAFAAAARASVRQAFLANLAADAWVLQPTPTPGRPWYQAAPESNAHLEWYPHLADIAGSGDLGFSSGPWIYSNGSARAYGHFLTLWRLDADCRWRVIFDGGVSHGQGAPELPRKAEAGPEHASTLPAVPGGGEAAAFQEVAAREGLGAALRTYAKNGDFEFLAEGSPPMGLDVAEHRERRHVIKGAWREASHGQSQDGSLRYTFGQVERGSYVEIWQYDAKVANWGLRILMITSA